MSLDFLAFGAHPDDIELGCAGTLIKLARRGYRTGAITLTRGESGTRGTPEIRRREFALAAERMLLAEHRALDIPDAAIAETQLNKLKLVQVMRELRPRLVASVHWHSRHPDHIHTSQLVRDAAVLDRAFAQSAPYLFQHGAEAIVPDIGPRAFQCSRRGDAVKVWAALLRYGQTGIAGFYDHLCALTSAFHGMVEAHPRFEALHLPETNILCFRYTGGTATDEGALDELNRRMRERYNMSGEGWITSTLLDGRRVLRVTIINPRTTEVHLAQVLDGLDRVGAALA